MTEVTTLQGAASSLQTKLTERLRENFVDLIPPETLSALAAAAMDEFINGAANKRFVQRGYGSYATTEPNPDYNPMRDPNTLPGMVMAMMKAHAETVVKTAIDSTVGMQAEWDQKLGESVRPLITEVINNNADIFMRGMLSSYVNALVSAGIAQMRPPGSF